MNDLNTLLTSIETKIEEFLGDAKLRLEKSNKSAGARSRKTSLELTNMLKEWRKLSVKN